MSLPFIGQITSFAGNFAPRDWAFCDGQLLPIAQNTALFSIIGTTYGGDGRTTMALPDLRGRAAVEAGTGPGRPTVTLGQKGGQEMVTLTTANMPAHTHAVTLHAENDAATVALPAGQMLGRAGTDTPYIAATPERNNVVMASQSIVQDQIGSAAPFENRNPFLGVNMIICLYGTYPSRS